MIPPQHRPAALLAQLRQRWGHEGDLWVFGYASLIWRPEFPVHERRPALVRGWHRAFRLRSVINRGTPERPGLVFGLLPGGACRGEVFRIAAARAEEELQRLWQREMPLPVYTPRWLPCRTAHGVVPALAFTLGRVSPACTPRLADAQMLEILRAAEGRCGRTLDYPALTANALRERGIRDREIERLMALAERAGLLQAAAATTARARARPSPDAASSSTPGSSTSPPSAG
jgi:cation transport protein ChaC